MKNCTFLDNNAIYGGGLYFYDGTAKIINCSFINNEANYGGAIYYSQFGSIKYFSKISNLILIIMV